MNTASTSIKKTLALVGGAVLTVAGIALASNAFAQTAGSNGTLDATVSSSTSVTATTTSATASTTDMANGEDTAALRDKISSLEDQVSSLRAQLSTLKADFDFVLSNPSIFFVGVSGTAGSSISSTLTGQISGSAVASSTASSSASVMTAVIAPQNASVRTGTSIDFTGHGFWNGEPVRVMNNGQTVATAYADGGGNFSTGSLPVTAASGASETYTFIGSWSGIMGSATVSVTP